MSSTIPQAPMAVNLPQASGHPKGSPDRARSADSADRLARDTHTFRNVLDSAKEAGVGRNDRRGSLSQPKDEPVADSSGKVAVEEEPNDDGVVDEGTPGIDENTSTYEAEARLGALLTEQHLFERLQLTPELQSAIDALEMPDTDFAGNGSSEDLVEADAAVDNVIAEVATILSGDVGLGDRTEAVSEVDKSELSEVNRPVVEEMVYGSPAHRSWVEENPGRDGAPTEGQHSLRTADRTLSLEGFAPLDAGSLLSRPDVQQDMAREGHLTVSVGAVSEEGANSKQGALPEQYVKLLVNGEQALQGLVTEEFLSEATLAMDEGQIGIESGSVLAEADGASLNSDMRSELATEDTATPLAIANRNESAVDHTQNSRASIMADGGGSSDGLRVAQTSEVPVTSLPSVEAAEVALAESDPSGSDAVWRQVQRAIGAIRATKEGDHEFKIRLVPKELGSITVDIRSSEAGVAIGLVAETSAASDRLNEQKDQLMRELAKGGLDSSSVDISHDGGGTDSSNQRAGSGSADRSAGGGPASGAALSEQRGSSKGVGRSRHRSTPGRVDIAL